MDSSTEQDLRCCSNRVLIDCDSNSTLSSCGVVDGCREYRPVPGAELISFSLQNAKDIYFQIIYFPVIYIYLHRSRPLSLTVQTTVTLQLDPFSSRLAFATITPKSTGKPFCVMTNVFEDTFLVS